MKITIENLTLKCIIGILPFERKKKQKVTINISFNYNYEENKFIDYSKVVKWVEKTVKKEKFLLIEDAIIYISEKLNKKYPIKRLKITIAKPDIIDNCIVNVSNK